MAYEFKKLSDVDVIESIDDNSNVLVENNGEIVKIAVDELVTDTVKTINNIAPDENGNIAITSEGIIIDPTLTQEGAAADAKVVGDKIGQLTGEIDSSLKTLIYQEIFADVTWENGLVSGAGAEISSQSGLRTVEYVAVNDIVGNIITAYTEADSGVTPYLAEYDADKNFLVRTYGTPGVALTPVHENCAYVRVMGYSVSVSQAGISDKIKIYYLNQKSIEWLYESSLAHDVKIDSAKLNSDVALNLFRNDKHFSHLFIDKTGGGANDIIPCQSIHDIAIASRLGFHLAEANCHKISDANGNSKYITMHGDGDAIGRQIVLKKYVDNAYGNATENDPDGTLKFANETLLIADQTFENLRDNYVYWSKYPKYRTRITSLDEFLIECKKHSLVPIIQYVDDEQLQLIRRYVGEDFILYASSRHGFNGMIYAWAGSNPTKDKVIGLCERIESPLMVGFSLTTDSVLTDDDLKEMIDYAHQRKCLIGFASCYTPHTFNNRLWNLGVDFSGGTASDVNDFENGNLINAAADVSFDDFVTTGNVENSVLKLSVGDTITIDGLTTQFLAKGSLHIHYKGTIGMDFGHFIRSTLGHTFTSDGTSSSWFSTYFMEAIPKFTITAVDETEVYMLNYRASKC